MSQIDIPFIAVNNKGLEVKNITKSYNNKRILDNVSLDLNRGESVALLGPNGAGKTSLFYITMGLIKADSGSVNLDKKEISEFPMYRRSKLGLGYFNKLYKNRKNLEIIMPALGKNSYNVELCAKNKWSIVISNFCSDELIENHIKNYIKFFPRQALHSHQIEFVHPILNKQIKITCDLPDDMKDLNNNLL